MQQIKSIRILSSRSPLSKQTFKQTEDEQIFSFSKKDKIKRIGSSQDDLSKQREQINNLQRMIKGVLKKCQMQSLQIQAYQCKQSQWAEEKQKNDEYRTQLLQLKDLMKKLLFQRQKSQAFEIYDI